MEQHNGNGNRRKRQRYGLHLNGCLVLSGMNGLRRRPVTAFNISSTGCYLITESRVRVGDTVAVELSWCPEDEGRSVLHAEGNVLRVERLQYGESGVALLFQMVPVLRERLNDACEVIIGTPPLFTCDEINHAVFQYYPALRRVKDFVEENYREQISLKAAAQIANRERTYFCALFHRKVGVSYTEWLRGRRIAEAIRLMSEVDCSITHIAKSVGFDSPGSFGRAFKRYTLMKPLQFKKLLCPMPSPSLPARPYYN